MDKLGPMCRSAEDCALVLQAIAGPDARDPGSAGRTFRFRRQGTPAAELRVGYLADDFERVHPSARRAMQEAVAAMRSLRSSWKRVALPRLPIAEMARTIIAAEGSTMFEGLIRGRHLRHLADRRQQIGLRAGLEITAVSYITAMRLRRLLQEAFARLFSDVDVLLAPSRLVPATRLDEPLDPLWRPGRPVPAGRRTNRGLRPGGGGGVALIPAGNLAGLPAVSLPCGFTTTALPVGLQLVGRPFEEGTLIDLGRAFQRITNWHRRRPPVPGEMRGK